MELLWGMNPSMSSMSCVLLEAPEKRLIFHHVAIKVLGAS